MCIGILFNCHTYVPLGEKLFLCLSGGKDVRSLSLALLATVAWALGRDSLDTSIQNFDTEQTPLENSECLKSQSLTPAQPPLRQSRKLIIAKVVIQEMWSECRVDSKKSWVSGWLNKYYTLGFCVLFAGLLPAKSGLVLKKVHSSQLSKITGGSFLKLITIIFVSL